MNRINPFHIILALLILLLILSVSMKGIKSDLVNAKAFLKETTNIAISLKGFNEVYSSKKNLNKSIDRLLKQSSLKGAKIDKKIGTSGLTLSSESMDLVELNSMMGKLLNGTYNIESLDIKRLSDVKVSFEVELRW